MHSCNFTSAKRNQQISISLWDHKGLLTAVLHPSEGESCYVRLSEVLTSAYLDMRPYHEAIVHEK